MIAVPAYSEKSQTTAYYEEGSLAAGRPGYFNVNTYDLKSRPKWEMEALTSHEAVPGHHLQIALAQELERVPEWRKHGDYTAFVEGWGLYAESLGAEIGLYKDPYAKFGQLTYEMLARDPPGGRHRHAHHGVDARSRRSTTSRPTPPRPSTTSRSRSTATSSGRGRRWPTRSASSRSRSCAPTPRRSWAPKFDVRAFHDHVLGNGAVPLDLLEKNVMAWVAEVKSGEGAKAAR